MSHGEAGWERARREAEQRKREADARELLAIREETARYHVLVDELEALSREAAEVSVTPPRGKQLRAGSSSEIAQQNAELQELLEQTRVRIRTEPAQRRAARQVQDYLAGLHEIDAPVSTRASRSDRDQTASGITEVSSAAVAISVSAVVERHLSKLAPGARLSDDALALIATLEPANPDLGAIIARDLQAEISKINRDVERRDAAVARLRELDVRARTLGDPELMLDVQVALDEPSGITDDRLDDLTAQIAAREHTAEQQRQAAEAEADRQHVQGVLTRALKGMGYEVVTGFETTIPDGGVLLRRPDYDFHAMQATVDADLISMEVVRTTLESDRSVSDTRDHEAHVALHADMREALDRVRAEGVELGRVRELEPGDVAIPALSTARTAPQAPRATGKPKERGL